MRSKKEIEDELKKLLVLYKSQVTQAYRPYILAQIQFANWVLGQNTEQKKDEKTKKEGKK